MLGPFDQQLDQRSNRGWDPRLRQGNLALASVIPDPQVIRRFGVRRRRWSIGLWRRQQGRQRGFDRCDIFRRQFVGVDRGGQPRSSESSTSHHVDLSTHGELPRSEGCQRLRNRPACSEHHRAESMVATRFPWSEARLTRSLAAARQTVRPAPRGAEHPCSPTGCALGRLRPPQRR
jgi:hypothetical protein